MRVTMPTTETKLLAKMRKVVKSEGRDIVFVKRHGSAFARSGEPDVLVLWDDCGWTWHIELKVGSNLPTPIQLARLNELRNGGHQAGVLYPADIPEWTVSGIERALRTVCRAPLPRAKAMAKKKKPKKSPYVEPAT